MTNITLYRFSLDYSSVKVSASNCQPQLLQEVHVWLALLPLLLLLVVLLLFLLTRSQAVNLISFWTICHG